MGLKYELDLDDLVKWKKGELGTVSKVKTNCIQDKIRTGIELRYGIFLKDKTDHINFLFKKQDKTEAYNRFKYRNKCIFIYKS